MEKGGVMIFQHTWEKVLSGEKTQTRRLAGINQFFDAELGAVYTLKTSGRFALDGGRQSQKAGAKIYRYQSGKTYAVQPGRGKKAIARIEVMGIRREDVRNISGEDVRAEGFVHYAGFMITWMKMHDKPFLQDLEQDRLYDFNAALEAQPAERYAAWVLEFKLVQP